MSQDHFDLEQAAINLVEDTTHKVEGVVGTVAGQTITVAKMLAALGTTASFIPAMEAAVKAKNYELEAELSLYELVAIAAALGLPYAGLAKILLPFLFVAANNAPELFASAVIPQVTTDLEENLQDRFEQGKSR